MKAFGLISLFAFVFVSACGEDRALLDVELELPLSGGTGTRMWAFVEVQADAKGDFLWPPGEGTSKQLLVTPATLEFGVPATKNTGMRMRVSFCYTANCNDVQDLLGMAPQIGYRIERSHYLFETTRFVRSIDKIPPEGEAKEVIVGKCEIEGCWSKGDTGGAIVWCERDGRHACE